MAPAELSPLIIVILTMLVLIGLAMWFIERQVQAAERSSESAVAALRDGLYWAVVTMTTVGYGDKTPKTTSGRIVAILWMLSSLVAPAYMAIALPEHSPLKKPIDRALIKITNSSEWRALEERFFVR
jgi:polar amino acid transport system substrate-binding protein